MPFDIVFLYIIIQHTAGGYSAGEPGRVTTPTTPKNKKGNLFQK